MSTPHEGGRRQTPGDRHGRRAGLVLCGIAVWLLATAVTSSALVVVKRDFPQLVGRAEQIVVGTVTDIRNELDQSGTPWTLVTLADLTVLKGDVGQTLTLRIYGGRAGDVIVDVPDMPQFTIGERAMVFVAGNGKTVCPLVGVWQGRFHVRTDPERGVDVVEDAQHQPVVGLAGTELQRAPLQPRAATQPAMTLDEFRQLVADEIAHPHVQ